jgi:hypothetical protein
VTTFTPEFCNFVLSSYEEAMKWRKNLFKVPSGKAGKDFINLLSEWLMRFNNEDAFMGVSLKVYLILPNLLLQKPSSSLKEKEHSQALNRRIEWLRNGELQRILTECRNIQDNLRETKRNPNLSKTFANLVMQGKINAALRLLEDDSSVGVLPLSDEVMKSLRKKLPLYQAN